MMSWVDISVCFDAASRRKEMVSSCEMKDSTYSNLGTTAYESHLKATRAKED